MSRAERRVMVRCPHPGLSLSRQCRLLSIGRSWLYYTPKGTVKLSRICPFCGRILLDQRLRINDLSLIQQNLPQNG